MFYGTDRNREAPETRVVYGSERARRLELGRALVTVPKAHEVPNIERPWVYRLPFTQIVLYSEAEDPKRHFTLKEVRSLTKDEFLRLVRERLGPSRSFKDHALIFVHGFNTSFEHALFRTAQIAYDIKFDGAPSSTAGRRRARSARRTTPTTAKAPARRNPTCSSSWRPSRARPGPPR